MEEDGTMDGDEGMTLESPMEYMRRAMNSDHEMQLSLANGGVFLADHTAGVAVHVGMSSERSKDLRRIVADHIRQWGLQGKWNRMDGSELYPEESRGE